MTEARTTARPTRWGTYADAERMTGLSRWTLWRMAKRGDIKAAKVGRSLRIDLDSLDAYLDERAAEYTTN